MSKKEHNSVTVSIKKAKVDKRMAKIIDWLNRFKSIQTIYSCQGDGGKTQEALDEEGSYDPYILFTCNRNEDLAVVLECINQWYSSKPKLEVYPEINVSIYNNVIRYTIRFNKRKDPNSLVNFYYNTYKKNFIKSIP